MKMCKVCKKKSVPYARAYACSECWKNMAAFVKAKLEKERKSLSLRGNDVKGIKSPVE